MSGTFNPEMPPVPIGSEGTVLAMAQGGPLFLGGITTAYQAAVPVGIPSSGSIGNNGALTGLTTQPSTYPAAYLFFPAGAIAAGSAAGFYYCQMSSATAGTIFNNTLAAGAVPVEIPSPTPFVTTGPGAYTQVLTAQTLLSFTVRGGAMRKNGALQCYNLFSLSNSANNKSTTLLFGGQAVQVSVTTTSISYENIFWVYNAGRVNRQVLSPLVPTAFGGSANSNVYLTVNTGNDFAFSVTGQLANAADFIILEALTAQLVNAT